MSPLLKFYGAKYGANVLTWGTVYIYFFPSGLADQTREASYWIVSIVVVALTAYWMIAKCPYCQKRLAKPFGGGLYGRGYGFPRRICPDCNHNLWKSAASAKSS